MHSVQFIDTKEYNLSNYPLSSSSLMDDSERESLDQLVAIMLKSDTNKESYRRIYEGVKAYLDNLISYNWNLNNMQSMSSFNDQAFDRSTGIAETEQDIYVKMSPKKRYKVSIDIKNVKKAKPKNNDIDWENM